MEKRDNYFRVTYGKELEDSKLLLEKIKESKWLKPDLVLVNCFPEYSSRLTQFVNHKLSYLNKNELFEVIDLQMPFPNMAQVWNQQDKSYQFFDKYLAEWAGHNINSTYDYLFIGASVPHGKNFSKIRSIIKPRLEPSCYRFASLYIKEDTLFVPDFYIEKVQGSLLFEWENMDNPNW